MTSVETSKFLQVFEKEEKFFSHVIYSKFLARAQFSNFELEQRTWFEEDPELKLKDISFLLSPNGAARKIENIIIIDNDPCKYSLHLNNGVPIDNFYGETNDDTLEHLEHYLMTLTNT